MKPQLARGELRCVARPRSTNTQAHRKDPALERRSSRCRWPSRRWRRPSRFCAVEGTLRVHHGVRIQDSALVAATLSNRYITTGFCRTRRLTWWTRRRRASRWSWIPSRRNWTSWIGRFCNWKSSARRWPRKRRASKERLKLIDRKLPISRQIQGAHGAMAERESRRQRRQRGPNPTGAGEAGTRQPTPRDLTKSAESSTEKFPTWRKSWPPSKAIHATRNTKHAFTAGSHRRDIAKVVASWTHIP